MGKIVLNGLTKVKFNEDKNSITSATNSQSDVFKNKVNGLAAKDNKLVFSGNDYSGSFKANDAKKDSVDIGSVSSPNVVNLIEGTLELELETSGRKYTFNGIKISLSSTKHEFTKKAATIILANAVNDELKVTEEDSLWFKTVHKSTQKLDNDSTFQSCMWNEFNFPEECGVFIDFI